MWNINHINKEVFGFTIAMFMTISAAGQSNARLFDSTLVNYNMIFRGFIQAKRDSIRKDSVASRLLSHGAFDQFFRNKLSLLAYNRGSFSQGNTASLSFSEDKTNLNLSISYANDRSIFTLGSMINVKDNTGTIFSDSKPTSGTQLFVDHAILFRSSRNVTYTLNGAKATQIRRLSVLDSVENANAIFQSKFRISQREEENLLHKDKGVKKRISEVDSLGRLKKIWDDARHNYRQAVEFRSQLKIEQKTVDSLRDILNNTIKIDTVLYQKYLTDTIFWKTAKSVSEELIAIAPLRKWGKLKAVSDTTSLAAKLDTLELSPLGLLTSSLNWFSYGLSYQKLSINTYDSLLPISKRVRPFDYSVWSGHLSLNFFTDKTDTYLSGKGTIFKNLYFGITYSFSGNNSYTSFDDLDYSTTKSNKKLDSLFQVSSAQKVKNITSVDLDYFIVHKAVGQFSGMFRNGKVGINAIGTGVWRRGQYPLYEFRLGAIFKYTDSGDLKSKVNFELFLDLPDLVDSRHTGRNTFQRSSVGISATVPFQKILLN